jgi:UDP-N-acetylglucosamine--N-acetylmuramyl-(pentapeptide) pyrophosphoryl-undecaprenol N-acetylglucosamine transferase
MQKLGLEPLALANAAERAKACGRPQAAKDLADLVERVGRDPALVGVEESVNQQMPRGAFA